MRTVSLALALAALPVLAHADDDEGREPTEAMWEAASTGAFLPFGDTPANNASTAKVIGSYDTARNRSSVLFMPVAQLLPWLELRASLTYEDESFERAFAAGFGLLAEEDDGLDLELGGGWDSNGTNHVDAAFAQVIAGRSFAASYMIVRARFDVGTSDTDERGLVLGLSSSRPLSMNLYAGFDTQLKLDLERDADEAMGESTWRLNSGPHVSYAVSHYVITGSVGLAVDRPRMEARDVGVYGAVGVGTAF